MNERGPESTPTGLPMVSPPANTFEGEAMRRRIASRLFSEVSEPLRIGRFRIQRSLGHGGMGVVYAAEDDTLDRLVALKVIRPDATAPRARERQRLLDEARALARLSHPNVISIYEVGEHGDEIFIAMEYVRGCTLLQWLATPRSQAEIVAMFVAAGRGLAAAHAAGLVHRDFKPGNVLVGEDGRARIVDFGLARGPRAVSASSSSSSSSTSQSEPTRVSDGGSQGTEPHAGTPGYMSPEQALGRGCDAHSDQFSFCVALHEALYGRRPFRKDVVAAVVHQDVLRPPAVGAQGRVPGWLRRVLTRGLAFAPEARHESMAALLVALERGPWWRYRSRWLLAGAAGLAIAGGLGFELRARVRQTCPYTNQALLDTWSPARREAVRRAFQATQPPERADAAWTELAQPIDRYAQAWARASRDACEQTNIHGEQAPRWLYARWMCLEHRRQDLANVVELIERRDPATAEGARELMARLPTIEHCTGEAADADVQALDTRRQAAHAGLGRARQLQQAGRLDEARRRLGELLSEARVLADQPLELDVQLLRGTIEGRERRDFAAADESLIAAAALGLNVGPHASTPEVWNELALNAALLAEDAVRARRDLKLARAAAGSRADPLLLASFQDTESEIVSLSGDRERVETLRRAALEQHQKWQPPGHPELARARMRLANALADLGKAAQARELLLALRDEQRRALGDSHPSLLEIERALAYVYIELDEPEPAEATLVRARQDAVRLFGESSSRVASLDLPLALIDAGRDPRAAIQRLRVAVAALSAHHAPDYSERIFGLQVLADLLYQTGQHAAALAVNSELLALHDRGAKIEIDSVLVNVGDYLCLLDRCDEAVVPYTRLLTLAGESGTPGAAGLPLQGLGRVYLAKGQPRLALGLLEQAREIFIRTPRPTQDMLEQTTRLIAGCLVALKEPKRAREMLAEADRLRAELAASAAAP